LKKLEAALGSKLIDHLASGQDIELVNPRDKIRFCETVLGDDLGQLVGGLVKYLGPIVL